MPFGQNTSTLLQYYTANPPPTEGRWHGLWTSILTALFKPEDGFLVTHHQRVFDDSESHIPGFVQEVFKMAETNPPILRTVLIIKTKNTENWTEYGRAALDRQITRQTEAAFLDLACSKVYWIGAVGPHWRYGVKDSDESAIQPLIPWHDTLHDDASYDDFQQLVNLVSALK